MQIHGEATPELSLLLGQGVHGLEKEPKVLEVP